MTQPLYACPDFYLASFLLYQGAVLVGCTRLGPKRVEFRFVADERLHQLLRAYWSRRPVHLVAAELFDAHRRLKSRDGFDA